MRSPAFPSQPLRLLLFFGSAWLGVCQNGDPAWPAESILERLRSASPDVASDGMLCLLEKAWLPKGKEARELFDEVETLVGQAPKHYPDFPIYGSTDTVANRRRWFSTRKLDRLQLTVRLFALSAEWRPQRSQDYFASLLRLRRALPVSNSCALELLPDAAPFYSALGQFLGEASLARSGAGNAQPEDLRTVFSELRSFGELEAAANFLSRAELSSDLRESGLDGLLASMSGLTHEPAVFRLRSALTHAAISRLLQSLSGSGTATSLTRSRLGRTYRDLVLRQLTAGYCDEQTNWRSTRLGEGPMSPALESLWRRYHDSPVGAEYPIAARDWQPDRIPRLPAATPLFFGADRPIEVGNCVAGLLRSYGRSQPEPHHTQAEINFRACFASLDRWKPPGDSESELTYFHSKADALQALAKAALGAIGQGPIRSATPGRAERSARIDARSASPAEQALERWVAFIQGPEGKKIKGKHRESWFGQVIMFLDALRSLSGEGQGLFWSILARYPDPDLQAMAILDGFSPLAPRLR